MTLDEAKTLLNLNGIPFGELHFGSLKEFRLHMSPFDSSEEAEPYAIRVLVICSRNGHKNIELQFADKNNDGSFTFIDLYFGQYFFELFDCEEELLPQSIVDEIEGIMSGSIVVIVCNDLKKRRWYGDAIFDKRDNDGFGLPGYEKAMRKIEAKKTLAQMIRRTKRQYEIFDWNTYRLVVK